MDLKGVPAVGDHLRDLQAAIAVGCEPHLVMTGKGAQYKGQSNLPKDFPANTQAHVDLSAFVDWLLLKTQAAAKSSAKATQNSHSAGSSA
jgi:D-glycero-D-manno-heptose 1,7-bisphosphate phosphatase